MELESLPYHITCSTCQTRYGNGIIFFSNFEDNAERVKSTHLKYNHTHNVTIITKK